MRKILVGSWDPYFGQAASNTLWLFNSLPWQIAIEIVDLPMKNGDFL